MIKRRHQDPERMILPSDDYAAHYQHLTDLAAAAHTTASTPVPAPAHLVCPPPAALATDPRARAWVKVHRRWMRKQFLSWFADNPASYDQPRPTPPPYLLCPHLPMYRQPPRSRAREETTALILKLVFALVFFSLLGVVIYYLVGLLMWALIICFAGFTLRALITILKF